MWFKYGMWCFQANSSSFAVEAIWLISKKAGAHLTKLFCASQDFQGTTYGASAGWILGSTWHCGLRMVHQVSPKEEMVGQEQPFLTPACFSILRHPSCPLHRTALRRGSLNTQGSGRVSVLAWRSWKVGLSNRLLSSIKTDYKCCKWTALFFVAHSRPFFFF